MPSVVIEFKYFKSYDEECTYLEGLVSSGWVPITIIPDYQSPNKYPFSAKFYLLNKDY